MTTPQERSPARITMTVIGLVLATLLVLFLAYESARVLIWIVIAAFFATALHPVASWVENHVRWVRRWLSTLVVFLLVFAVIAGLVTLFVVPLVNEGTRFVDQLPQLVKDIQAGKGPIGGVLQRFHIQQFAAAHSAQIRSYMTGLGGSVVGFVQGAATTVAGIVTIFVLSYLMVLEAPRITIGFLGLFEARRAERIRRVGSDCARTITGYISGNLLISVICGVLTWIVLLVLGVPFAGLIALFVAIADLIPLIGATLGAIVAVLAGFAHSVTAGIVVIVFYVLYQQLENHLLQPVILSRTVQLDPLTVLVSILVASELAGILGALLAIPVAAMIQIIARDLWRERRGQLFSEGAAAPAGTADLVVATDGAPPPVAAVPEGPGEGSAGDVAVPQEAAVRGGLPRGE